MIFFPSGELVILLWQIPHNWQESTVSYFARDKPSLCALRDPPFTQLLCSYLQCVDKTMDLSEGYRLPQCWAPAIYSRWRACLKLQWRESPERQATQPGTLKHHVKEAWPTNQKSGSAEKARNKDYEERVLTICGLAVAAQTIVCEYCI